MPSGYWDWQSFFQALNNWGLSDVLLPFLLVFAITYAILHKTKIPSDKKNLQATLAFILGFMFVMPHLTGQPVLGYDPVVLVNSVMPTIGVLLVAILLFFVLIGLFIKDEYKGVSGGLLTFVVIVSVLIVLYVFGAAAGWWTGWDWLTNLLGGTDVIAIIVMLLIFGLVVLFVTGDENESVLGIFKGGSGGQNQS